MKRRRLLVAGLAAVTLAVLWVLVFRPFFGPPFDFIDPGAIRVVTVNSFWPSDVYIGSDTTTGEGLRLDYYLFRGDLVSIVGTAERELRSKGYQGLSLPFGGNVFQSYPQGNVSITTAEEYWLPEFASFVKDEQRKKWIVVRITRPQTIAERAEDWVHGLLP